MIVIHIGAAKAGSTTIQEFLGENADALRKIGIDYPSIGQTQRGWHANLVYELRGHRNFKTKYGTLSDLVDDINRSRSKITILSAEGFESCKAAEVAALREELLKADEDIRIIFVIRELIDLMPSIYSQVTKNGENAMDFDSFFLARARRRGNAFVDTCKVWGGCFGWDRLRVRVLDRKRLVNGDLVDDFLTVVGIDPSAGDFQRSVATSVANASPGWRVLEAVRALYAGGHGLPAEHPLSRSLPHAKDTRKIVGQFARILGGKKGWNADRGRYLSYTLAQQSIDMHAETVDLLNQVLPESLPQPLDLTERDFVAREFMPDASRIPALELRRLYDEIAARAARKHPTVLST